MPNTLSNYYYNYSYSWRMYEFLQKCDQALQKLYEKWINNKCHNQHSIFWNLHQMQVQTFQNGCEHWSKVPWITLTMLHEQPSATVAHTGSILNPKFNQFLYVFRLKNINDIFFLFQSRFQWKNNVEIPWVIGSQYKNAHIILLEKIG